MEEKFSLWLILDLFVRIITMLAVVTIIAKYHSGIILTILIILFIAWAFRPIYLAFKNFKKDFPAKKKIRKNSKAYNKINLLYFSAYFFIFMGSLLIFTITVVFLGQAVHPLVLASAFIFSSLSIFLYHYFSKREFKGVLWLFSKFFFISTFFLFLAVIFFAQYDMSRGVNLEEKNVSFDVYVVDNALPGEEVNSALEYSRILWKEYNILINYNPIIEKNINLTPEEAVYLFSKGNSEEECLNYTSILNRITNNSTNLSVIFLDNNNSGHAGRGSLCGHSFALVSKEKLLYFDFTGWNVAHETGHVLGLLDIQFYGRTRNNLMNDEFKKLLFFNSDFLSQSQIDTVVNSINNKNETKNKTN